MIKSKNQIANMSLPLVLILDRQNSFNINPTFVLNEVAQTKLLNRTCGVRTGRDNNLLKKVRKLNK